MTFAMTGVANLRVLESVTSPSAGGSNEFVAVSELGALPLAAAQTAVVKLPDDTFRHSIRFGGFQLSATLADGSPLPRWVSFGGTNGRFTLQPSTY
jgi:hypothetical protein